MPPRQIIGNLAYSYAVLPARRGTKQEELKMTNTEAYKIIGERTQELSNIPEVQAEMVKMVHNGATKEEAEKWLYMCAIGTLMGITA